MIKGQKIAESLYSSFSGTKNVSEAPKSVQRLGGENLKQYDDLTSRINENTRAIQQNEAFIEENKQRSASLGKGKSALKASIEQETMALERQNKVLQSNSDAHEAGRKKVEDYANSIGKIRRNASIAVAAIGAVGSVVNIVTDTISTSAKVMMSFGSILSSVGSGLLMSGAGAPIGIGLLAVGEGLNIAGSIKATADRKKAAEEAAAAVEKAKVSINTVDNSVDGLNTTIQETEKNVESLADKLTQAFNSAYDSAKNLLDLNINEKLYGDQSIEQAKKYFEIIKNYQEDVLSKSEKTISLSNIQNDLNNQIKNVYDPKTAKLALGFNEYLKTLKLSQNQMTAKELEYIKQQYSFIQKRLDAEKETANIQELILVRDEAGNYTYQFSQQQAGKKSATTDVASIEAQRTSAKQGISGAISGLISLLDNIKGLKDTVKSDITAKIQAGKLKSADDVVNAVSTAMKLDSNSEVIKSLKSGAVAKFGEKTFFENQYKSTSMASALGTFNTPESRRLIDILMSSKTPITSVEGLKKASGGNISSDILTAITGSLSDANTEIKAMNNVLPDTLNGLVTTFDDFKTKMDKLFDKADGLPGIFNNFGIQLNNSLQSLKDAIDTKTKSISGTKTPKKAETPAFDINNSNFDTKTEKEKPLASGKYATEIMGLPKIEDQHAVLKPLPKDELLYEGNDKTIGQYAKEYSGYFGLLSTGDYNKKIGFAKALLDYKENGDSVLGSKDIDRDNDNEEPYYSLNKYQGGTFYIPKSYLDDPKGSSKRAYWVPSGASYRDGYEYSMYDTGGYTGDWDGSGKFAMLHQKEIVLNKEDTSNILAAVQIMRDYAGQLGSVMGSRSIFNNKSSNEAKTTVINASFPNVSVADEIKKAFESMSNEAIQYGYRTKTY